MRKTTLKWMNNKYDNSKCTACDDPIPEGAVIAYDYSAKVVYCENCGVEEQERQERLQATAKDELEDLESKFE